MKIPDVHKMFPYEMRLHLYTHTDMAPIGDAVFDALEADPELTPQKYGRYEPFRTTLPEVRRLWQEEAAKRFGAFGGERKRPFYVGFEAKFGPDALKPFHMIWMSFDLKVLRHDGARRIETLFRRLVTIADPYWGSAEHSGDFERQNVFLNYPTERGTIEPYRVVGLHPEKAIPGLYWLNYFGPQLTALMPVVREAKEYGAEPLGKGVLLKLAGDPEAMLLPESIERAERCKRDLGPPLFFDRNLPGADRVP